MLILVLGLVGAVVLFVETRVPGGTIPRALFRRPGSMLGMAGALAIPALLLACADHLKARAITYVPPSGRVQAARTLAYGLALGAANFLLVLSQAPEIIFRVRTPGVWVAIWFVASIPYGFGSWYLCLRRREFDRPEAPTYPAVVDALSDTDDFLVGLASDDPKGSRGMQQRWQVIPEVGMVGNIYVLGGIGSGKTSSLAKPVLEQAIFKWPRDPMRKNAVFALDAKGNMAEWIWDVARLAGREEDVIILKRDRLLLPPGTGAGTPPLQPLHRLRWRRGHREPGQQPTDAGHLPSYFRSDLVRCWPAQ